MTSTHHDISQLCSALGKDRLLVQGAGGNVSWKEDSILWVKGSGTWLANADKEDLFVPVNLTDMRTALSQANFDSKPQVIGEQPLRPSIETILHALMPQIIVVHLHAIDALAHLVTRDSQATIQRLFKEAKQSAIHAIFIGYHKPGPELAQAIDHALSRQPNANVVFLKNHGIVIGGSSSQEIWQLLQSITDICKSENAPQQRPFLKNLPMVTPECAKHYVAFPDINVQELALDPTLFKRLKSDWVLFPDHAVFLGQKAFTYVSWADFLANNLGAIPELIFIENVGVFIKPDFSLAKIAQLGCYFDVISRVAPDAHLEPLDEAAIYALLSWGAEKHRQQMNSFYKAD
jgi:rhamnose utilization protein RhaD (predicted bifunctional aldolase and dehydrogenase)